MFWAEKYFLQPQTSAQINEFEMNVSSLRPGLYFFSLRDGKKKVWTQKLMKN